MTQEQNIHKGKILEDMIEMQTQESKIIGHVIKFVDEYKVHVLTNNVYKTNSGSLGLPKGEFLLMIPTGKYTSQLNPHMLLLRKTKVADIPQSSDDLRRNVERLKANQPLNNVIQIGDLMWSAFEAFIVGGYITDVETQRIKFYREIPGLATNMDYTIYTPTEEMLNIITNSTVLEENSQEDIFKIGALQISEFGSIIKDSSFPKIPVHLAKIDFINTRTAIFGKTRQGKSNIAKKILKNMNGLVCQIMFDIEGEYCNKNHQDNNRRIADMIPNSVVFGLSKRPDDPERKIISADYYRYPHRAFKRLATFLHEDRSNYVGAAFSIEMPSIQQAVEEKDEGIKQRQIRKIKLCWGILSKAGFRTDDYELPELRSGNGNTGSGERGRFCLGLSQDIMKKVYEGRTIDEYPRVDNLSDLVEELERIAECYYGMEETRRQQVFKSKSSGNQIFDGDDISLLRFFAPTHGRAGTEKLKKYRKYHNPDGGDGTAEILRAMDENKTIFIDISREDKEVVEQTTDEITRAIFNHRVDEFASNEIEPRSMLLYYEEAHNLFPLRNKWNNEPQTIYERIAKEGAKYGIGMVYITQSPSSIDNDLLSQTNNFFVVSMSSREEVDRIIKLNNNFEGHDDILRMDDKGHAKMLTQSNKFVVPVQVDLFTE